MSVSFYLPHPVAVSAFIICSGLCACTEMLWMCVLYVSFRYKVRSRTFGCLAMGCVVYFEVQIALVFCRSEQSVSCLPAGFSLRLFSFVPAKTLCRYGCIYSLAAVVLVCVDVMVMSSVYAMT